jgi:hypothetical protein
MAQRIRGKELARPGSSSRKPEGPRSRAVRQPHSGTVTEDDLKSLDAVKQLLVALNDAYASTEVIEELVEAIPCLRARCIKRASGPDLAELDMPLPRALSRIGNMGLEGELLLLLEDLTVLQAELREPGPSLA